MLPAGICPSLDDGTPAAAEVGVAEHCTQECRRSSCTEQVQLARQCCEWVEHPCARIQGLCDDECCLIQYTQGLGLRIPYNSIYYARKGRQSHQG